MNQFSQTRSIVSPLVPVGSSTQVVKAVIVRVKVQFTNLLAAVESRRDARRQARSLLTRSNPGFDWQKDIHL
ncbi:MAG: hypothetical protein ABSF50_21880 [Burkholderiaceae bacterium]|jgi:hypothetical protein